MMYLTTTWFGIFLHDGERIIEKKLFPRDATEISSRLYKIQKGELLEEEREFKKYEPIVGERRLKGIGKTDGYRKLKIKGADFGYSFSLLIDACIKVAERRVKEEEGKRENRISQAVNALDEIIKIENILTERIADWYGFFGKYSPEKEIEIDIGEEKIDKKEEEIIVRIHSILKMLKKLRNIIEEYLEHAMKEIAPNTTKIAGYKIASCLLTAAGGIKRLATMPAGTIQLLGAEKALFRHLKDGAQPPKHGYLFLHEMVRKAPKDKRGKVARLLATKISMAAKADAFTGRNIGDKLMEEIKRRYGEIVEK